VWKSREIRKGSKTMESKIIRITETNLSIGEGLGTGGKDINVYLTERGEQLLLAITLMVAPEYGTLADLQADLQNLKNILSE
jgi:hypothetical protein